MSFPKFILEQILEWNFFLILNFKKIFDQKYSSQLFWTCHSRYEDSFCCGFFDSHYRQHTQNDGLPKTPTAEQIAIGENRDISGIF